MRKNLQNFVIKIIIIILINSTTINSYDIVFDIFLNGISQNLNLNNTKSNSFQEAFFKISNNIIDQNTSKIEINLYIVKSDSDQDNLVINEEYHLGEIDPSIFSIYLTVVPNYDLEKVYSPSKVVIDGSNAKEPFFIVNSPIFNRFTTDRIIFKNWDTNLFSISNSSTLTSLLEFSYCTFKSNLNISNNIGDKLTFSNCIFSNNSFINIHFNNIYFFNSHFSNNNYSNDSNNNNNNNFIFIGNFIQLQNIFFYNNNGPLITLNSKEINIISCSVYNNTFSKPFLEIKNNTIIQFTQNSFYNNSFINNSGYSLINKKINNENTSTPISKISIEELKFYNNSINNYNTILDTLLNIENSEINIQKSIININKSQIDIDMFINIINTNHSTINITKSILPSKSYLVKGYNNTISSSNSTNNTLADHFCNIINQITYECLYIPPDNSNSNSTENIYKKKNKVVQVVSVVVPINVSLIIAVILLIVLVFYNKKKKAQEIKKNYILNSDKYLNSIVIENVGTIESINFNQAFDQNFDNPEGIELENIASVD
ncbi:hypothetical protein DICPUDRAFT_75909 [Dictyostelium purpureum]|uniref:Right handed beta helix domain-containing protein n=1 Tax=Dictyostelium purpureum TaxID=5786 RepID=F0ZC11_DICPU|nr:uncharacterized protein DICPUDRAFT_75909 [Dictyostelium purpureum]EGC38488.1 hypothetical protein DICPUDRAFT_75909 [Dictyostelium purpureum]|eukprot:XP_003284953.1 hypothetical protein DICPUDRAFT_75909 [Dictyostelium purpureum]